MRTYFSKVFTFNLIFWMTLSLAHSNMLQHHEVRGFINDLVRHDHFDRKQVRAVLAKATMQPKIIEAMQRPYEKKNWDVYQALFLTPLRLQSGLEFWRQHAAALKQAEKQFGVPAEIIVAILGVETLYGKHQGNYRVLDALTTLSFHYPPRSAYFKRELREFFLLCREQGVSPTQYLGSYAGAIGKPQFMPSNYRTYAMNFKGKGRPDLISEDADVILSVANFFKQHGWQAQQPVVEQVEVPTNVQTLTLNSKTPVYQYPELLNAGVKIKVGGTRPPPKEVGLLELITDAGPEYWMAYPNFYVITRYNTSPQYALVVYLLAQSLREHYYRT